MHQRDVANGGYEFEGDCDGFFVLYFDPEFHQDSCDVPALLLEFQVFNRSEVHPACGVHFFFQDVSNFLRL